MWSRWVDHRGQVWVAGFSYRAGRVFTDELVDVVVNSSLVEVLHASVLIATHVQRPAPDKELILRHKLQRRTRRPGFRPLVVRMADRNGAVSFAGATQRAG